MFLPLSNFSLDIFPTLRKYNLNDFASWFILFFSLKVSYLLVSLHFSKMVRQKLHTVLQVKVDKPELGERSSHDPCGSKPAKPWTLCPWNHPPPPVSSVEAHPSEDHWMILASSRNMTSVLSLSPHTWRSPLWMAARKMALCANPVQSGYNPISNKSLSSW